MGEWISVKDRLPSKRGWYLVYIADECYKYRADDDTITNNMRVAYFRGNSFPYDNHYHHIGYWTSLPPAPGEVKLDV